MPVDFLTDEQASAYAGFAGTPSQTELERFFFLDDADRSVVEKRRGDANRLGFVVQLGTVHQLGAFLAGPVDVPVQVVDYVAGQLGIGDPSWLKTYARREKTRIEHQWEIARLHGYRDFPSAEVDLSRWIGDRAWTTGEGPRALFGGAVRRAGPHGAIRRPPARRRERHPAGPRPAGKGAS